MFSHTERESQRMRAQMVIDDAGYRRRNLSVIDQLRVIDVRQQGFGSIADGWIPMTFNQVELRHTPVGWLSAIISGSFDQQADRTALHFWSPDTGSHYDTYQVGFHSVLYMVRALCGASGVSPEILAEQIVKTIVQDGEHFKLRIGGQPSITPALISALSARR